MRPVRTSLFMGDAPLPLSSYGTFWVQVPFRDGCALEIRQELLFREI
jgi:hypothetical protein